MHHSSIGQLRRCAAVCLMLMCSTAPIPATAQDLDDAALSDLALRGTWQADHAEYGFWTWSADGSLCLRIGSMDTDCADTGTYTISDHVLCYELTWWGETVGERKGCFTVQDLGEDRYETVFHGTAMASRMFAFEVMD